MKINKTLKDIINVNFIAFIIIILTILIVMNLTF